MIGTQYKKNLSKRECYVLLYSNLLKYKVYWHIIHDEFFLFFPNYIFLEKILLGVDFSIINFFFYKKTNLNIGICRKTFIMK